MPIPSSKSELTETLKKEYLKLETELLSIPHHFSREKTVQGAVSVCEVVAYQIGWGELLIGWYEEGKKGKLPEMPNKNFKWNQLGDLAKHFYETYQNHSYQELLVEFEEVVAKIENIISENSNAQLYSIGIYNWTGEKWPLGRWININTSSPYKSARTKIRNWKKQKGIN